MGPGLLTAPDVKIGGLSVKFVDKESSLKLNLVHFHNKIKGKWNLDLKVKGREEFISKIGYNTLYHISPVQ